MNKNEYGPKLPLSREIHAEKYRSEGESFYEAMTRIANALKDSDNHFHDFRDILLSMRFLPAGRVQSAMGSPRKVTPYNCFVSGTIEDSFDGIMERAAQAGKTMRMGGGIGYDFSTLRPRGDRIVSLDSRSSGPISFMGIFDSVCRTISSAGHRRGAQMGVLRVDHPDIEEFVSAKTNTSQLTNFNISVGVTDTFMHAVKNKSPFDLKFDGRVYKTVDAASLWERIMRTTWDWAEPGVLFIDTINRMNNLRYCETIAATNPCAEQALPPYGACLLGSFNLTQYIVMKPTGPEFNILQFTADIPQVVRAMDNVVDRAIYPLPEQEYEAKSKRRMGLGVTGLANTAAVLGYKYGSEDMVAFTRTILQLLTICAYKASADLAAEKGPFPLYDQARYLESPFIQQLPSHIIEKIGMQGIRNSHLTSIAPTGTISLTADNVSSGIEPPFMLEYERTIKTFDGTRKEVVKDWAYGQYYVKDKTAVECSVDDHLNVLLAAAQWSDSAVSKTINCDPKMPWEDFKSIYMRAWEGGAKGCTTFNPAGKRMGILNATPSSEENQGAACFIDPETGKKTCE